MGDILDYCHGLLMDENLEGVFVSQKEQNNNSIIKKRKSDIKLKDVFVPINSTDENNNSQTVKNSNKLKSSNKNINSDEIKGINNIKKEYLNGDENDFIQSINRMSQIIESLESKNQILENEKNDIKKENQKLLKEIEIYKKAIAKIKNQSNVKNESENLNNQKINNKINEKKDEKIKIIFIFKNNKKSSDNNKEEKEGIMAYKYEMFIEVKLRLLKLKHLGPRDIKSCYYNSKEINDWFTLEELKINDNAIIICEYA